jgi:hypothetical protein
MSFYEPMFSTVFIGTIATMANDFYGALDACGEFAFWFLDLLFGIHIILNYKLFINKCVAFLSDDVKHPLPYVKRMIH